MKIKIGTLKRLIREAAMHEALGTTSFDFEVYGPNDETITCTASYNPRTPYEIEVWKAVGPDGAEIDVDDLRAQGHDLDAIAFENLKPASDLDPPGTGWDEPY